MRRWSSSGPAVCTLDRRKEGCRRARPLSLLYSLCPALTRAPLTPPSFRSRQSTLVGFMSCGFVYECDRAITHSVCAAEFTSFFGAETKRRLVSSLSVRLSSVAASAFGRWPATGPTNTV